MYWVRQDKPLNVSFGEWLLLTTMDVLTETTFDRWQWPAGVWCDNVHDFDTSLSRHGVECEF